MSDFKRDIFTISCVFALARFIVIPVISKMILLTNDLLGDVLIFSLGTIGTILGFIILFPCYIAENFINQLERNKTTSLS